MALAPLDSSREQDVRDLVLGFFADECDVDRGELSDETNIIVDLEGDSLMLLALLEKACRRYGITVPLKVLGRHLMKRPAETIGDIVRLTLALVEHGDDVVNVDL
jgi:acyl carrier protein